MNQHLWWYVARSSGLVGYALVTASVVWGLLVSTRSLSKRPGRGWLLDLHRHLGGLSVVFTAVHVAGLVADSYVHFGPSDVLVPLAARWHPVAVAWGVVAMYLLVAVEVTALLQRRLPRRFWRGVHMASFPLYVLATVHLATAGTDRTVAAVQWLVLAGATVVVFLTAFRLLTPRRKPARPRGHQALPRAEVTPTR